MVPVICLMAMAGAPAGSHVEILEFSATGCGPCRTIAPAIERLQAAGYPLRKIDVDQSPQLAKQYGVTHLPTVLILRDGQEVSRRVGARSYLEFVRWFKELHVVPVAAGSSPPLHRGQSPDEQERLVASAPRRAATGVRATEPSPRGARAAASGRKGPMRSSVSPGSLVQYSRRPSRKAVARALAATVRIRVEDDRGVSFGSGTVIDVAGSDALVVTCGHIFRDSNGKGRITVDLFDHGRPSSVEGRLLAYEADRRDIGFVVIRPGKPVVAAPVGRRQQKLGVGMSAFSIGCNRGAAPTVEETRITAVNRYAHGPNVEIEGQPVDGRSGGGLFSAEGELIGVCNAADFQEKKGLYASLPLVHEYLAKLGLERLIPPAAGSAVTPSAQNALAGNPAARGRALPPASSRGLQPSPIDSASDAPPLRVARGAGELICVVRDPATGRQRVIVVNQPTDELISQLEAAAGSRSRATPIAQLPRGGTPDGQPLVRAQSED